eukprot:scaffold241156_cov21-Tisochrysis_lutea.AAC.1
MQLNSMGAQACTCLSAPDDYKLARYTHAPGITSARTSKCWGRMGRSHHKSTQATLAQIRSWGRCHPQWPHSTEI